MDKRTLARLIVKSYDFKKKSQFDRIIDFLKTVMFHVEQSEEVQYTIWYLEDVKGRVCK